MRREKWMTFVISNSPEMMNKHKQNEGEYNQYN